MTSHETEFIIKAYFIFHIGFDSMFVLPAAMRAFFVPKKNYFNRKKGADKVKDLRVSTQTDFADLL